MNNSLLRFPEVLHQLLKDSEENGNEHIVSWLPCGCRFKVHNTKVFAESIMPRYFNHNRYKSFLRQLSLYEFRRGSWKSSPGPKGSYDHPFFLKDRLDLVDGVIRVKNRRLSKKSAWTKKNIIMEQQEDGGSVSMGSASCSHSSSSSVVLSTSDVYHHMPFLSQDWDCFLAPQFCPSDDIIDEIIETFVRGHRRRDGRQIPALINVSMDQEEWGLPSLMFDLTNDAKSHHHLDLDDHVKMIGGRAACDDAIPTANFEFLKNDVVVSVQKLSLVAPPAALVSGRRVSPQVMERFNQLLR